MLIPDRKVNAFAAIVRPFKGDKNSIPLALVNEIKP